MAERPILFQGAMVRALLAGTKTQTRRMVKPQPANDPAKHHPIEPYRTPRGDWNWVLAATGHGTGDPFPCPYGHPGDRLWVRETWQTWGELDGITPRDLPATTQVQYPASYDGWVSKRRPGIHMPRWASRILLEVTGVRVERLQDISEPDAVSEGIRAGPDGWHVEDGKHFHCTDPRQSYFSLWEAINGPGSVEANPWLWVVEFERLSPPADGGKTYD